MFYNRKNLIIPMLFLTSLILLSCGGKKSTLVSTKVPSADVNSGPVLSSSTAVPPVASTVTTSATAAIPPVNPSSLGAVSNPPSQNPIQINLINTRGIDYPSSCTDACFIDKLYLVFLGRHPEQEGLNYWLQRLASGSSRNDIIVGIAGSDEFYHRVGENTAAFVNALYHLILNREPELAGLAYWVNSGLSNMQIIQGFLDSPEYKSGPGL